MSNASDFVIKNGVLKKYIGQAWHIRDIIIPDGVLSIGANAFNGCSWLESIIIPDGVTKIGEKAFKGCFGIRNITISNSVTNIGSEAFYYCKALTSICIPDGVTSIDDRTFYNCSSLKSVVIPNGVTNIGDYAFDGCSSLISIIIPNGVISIASSAFERCSSLKNVTIPSSVTSIGHSAFSGCSSLTNIIIPDSVTEIGNYTFHKCEALADEAGLVIVNGILFDYFGPSGDVIIPDGTTCIGCEALRNCRNLTGISIPDSVTRIERSAFKECNLSSINVSKNNPWYHSKGNCLIESATKCLILGCQNSIIPDDETVTSIGESAFEYCRTLTSIVIPKNITSIGNLAFFGCSSLINITIPDSVAIAENAFALCPKLADENGFAIMQGVLDKYYGSEINVVIPNSVTHIDDMAFHGCNKITSIAIPNSVLSIGSFAFWGCTRLASINIPNSLKSIGGYAFYNCRKLKNITVPESVTSIGDEVFKDCKHILHNGFSEEVLCNTAGKDIWLRGAACIPALSNKTLEICPPQIRPAVDTILEARTLSTKELCSKIKQFSPYLWRYIELMIANRDDLRAAQYFETLGRLDSYAVLHNTDVNTLRNALQAGSG